jgi:prevent-host-death family protein
MSGMASYSVAEAKDNLPKLLDRALAGEEVTITRRGKPIARLVADVPRAMSIDLDWLERVRVTPICGSADDKTLVERMRSEAKY